MSDKKGKKMEMIMHLAMSDCHLIKYKVVGEDIYCEVSTPKKSGMTWGDPSRIWYHIDDKETHATYEEARKFVAKKEQKNDK